LHAQGVSQREIAARLGSGRGTVRRFVRADGFPERLPAQRRRPLLAPYEDYLRERWTAGCQNAEQLWRELRERGYVGAVRNVRSYLAHWRTQPGRRGPVRRGQRQASSMPPHSRRSCSPRQATWLLLRDAHELVAEDRAYVARLTAGCVEIQQAQQLTLSFHALLKQRDAGALERWLQDVEGSGIPELVGFASSVRADRAAVDAALTYAWSQGPVEGQVNRII
jgi:transposase